MRRTIATFLVGSFLVTSQALPVFQTGTGAVSMPTDFSGYINLGLQGVGRISASQLDAFGETFGSVSGLQVTNWTATATGYKGSFLTLPDRGYNSGAIYSDYRTRVQQVDFSFTPYTGTGSLSSSVSQFSLSYMGGGLVKLPGAGANTTGALPTTSTTFQVGSVASGVVPTTAAGKIALDAEGIALFRDGSGYITDEYGPNIYYVKDGQIAAVINPPASAMPRLSGGTLTYAVSTDGTAAVDPATGRRSNQGMEAVAISPDGTKLFTMLQSATIQDSTSGAQNRQYTRLYKYDVSASRTNPVLIAEYVVELPRFNDTKADQTGLLPNKVGAQSEMVALDGDRLLMLSRDGNGNGNSGVSAAVFKSVMLMDLKVGSPTNIASLDITNGYAVKGGTVSSPVISGTSTLTDTTTKLVDGVTAVNPVQFVNIIDQAQLAKFGLNTNDGSPTAPRTKASLSEKWEGMSLVSALDPTRPNDYFLFVANDNDFLTNSLKMKSTTGATVTTAGSLGVSAENDTMFLAYRITLPAGGADQSLLSVGSAAASASMAAISIVDSGTSIASGSSTYGISGTTLLVPSSQTITRPIDVGADGGALNLLGNQVVLSGSVSGTGALTVFGTSSGARLQLAGTNTFSGGLEINGVRVQAGAEENLGKGQVNLNAGAVLALAQSGTYSLATGFYVGGGSVEVSTGSLVVWGGSLTGPGSLTKTGKGGLTLSGSSTGFSGGINVSAGTLTLGTGTNVWSGGTGSVTLGSGTRLDLVMSGTVDLRSKLSAATDASVYWKGADSSSVLKLSTTVPLIYNTGQGTLSLGITNKALIYANGHYYQPLTAGLALGTPVYLDAEGDKLNATQRSLGYREVAYKKLFFGALGFAGAKVYSDADGNTIYDYGTQSTSTNLVGYWTKKNLPVILGPDGEGYITDGHHTTAGYLESTGAAILPGLNHIVLGTVVSNPSSQTTINTQFWQDLAGANNAYLYGTNGNQLIQAGEAQAALTYEGLQPVYPSSTNPMPTTPGKASMANDLYRSLTWAMADAVVKAATSVSGSKLAGFSKADPFSPTGADVNFVEFFWSDFLRDRVVWNDNAAVTSANLINAPVSFFAAAANGIGLAKSELYRDQFGRNVYDYTGEQFSANARSWANATLKNGLAVSGDTYNLFLGDDVSIKGDIIPSGVEGVTNNLYINAGSLLTVAGALQNFASISINTGAVLFIDWKDSAVNALTQNKTLSIPQGSADVLFSGDNDYSQLSSLVLGAGTLTIDTSKQATDQTLFADISGPGSLRKRGIEKLSLTGANTFSGGFVLEEGPLVLGSSSVFSGGALVSSPVGRGTLTVQAGAGLVFEESVRLVNPVRFISGTGVGTDSLLDLGNNSVELAGPVSSAISLQINGTPAAVLALSGSASLSGDLGVQTATVRLSPRLERAPAAITLRGGGGVQAAGDVVLPSAILVEDEGRFDSGESLLTLDGDISGSGRVLISGYSFGRVRLGGINSYSGGTSVEGTRVEVAVNAGGDNQGFSGSGRVFGSGEVSFKSASLGFVTSASVPNTLLINGELTIDVGANVGELSGFITDDVAGLGSVYITGTPKGALFLSGATNSYSGATIVEGTTLRVLNTADTSLLGTGTQPSGAPLAVQLDAATLQVVPDYNPASVAAFSPITTRDLVLGTRGATLDATDSNLVWSGVISGGDAVAGTAKLTVAGNAGTQVELTASNTYTGGTDVNGGVLVKVTSDSNLGAAGTKVTFNNGGLFYAGTGGVTFSRPIEVAGSGLIDVGSRTVTLGTLGTLSGSGVLEVGRTAYEGSTFSSTTGVLVVGDSAKGFTGRTILGGGSLLVSTSDALKNSTLEVSAGVGSVGFGSSSVNLGGLAGDMSLNFASPGILSVGLNGVNTRYAGILSGGSLTLRKVGSGNLSLGNVNAYSGPTVVDKGTLTLESGALVGSSLISMGSATSLVINGGSLDLSGKFADVEKSALVVYNGNASGVLTLPVGFAGKTLNLGQGSIKIGTAAATSGTTVAGMTVGLTSIQSIVTLNGGSVNLSSQGGAPIVLSDTASIRSQNPDDAVQIQLGEAVTMTAGLPTTSFKGYFQADGLITVAPASNSVAFELPRLKGAGKVSLTNGSTVLSASPDFKGTISLSTGASAVLTGSLDVGGSLGSVEVAAGASLSVLPEAVSQAVNVPALSGGGAISFGAGRVVLSGGNAAFTGNMTVSKGVEVTLRGDLPAGTILVSDPTVPLRVESSPSGNISLPGTVSGAGALALGGSGTFTMTGNAVIGTSQLRVGASASEKPTLDVSGLSGGVLTLSGSQTLSGGGTITGSVTTYGNFSPGNSPGTFTVATKTTNGVESGGNLTIGSGGSVTIEYGQRSGDPITFDKVDVGGTLTLEPGVKIVLRKFVDGGSWTSFVTPISLDLSSVFKANTIVIGGSYQVELEGTPLLSTVTNTSVVSSGSLSFRINKTSYAQVVGPAALQPLAGYLFSASISDPSVGLASFLSVLDASVTAGELTSYVAALQSPVYSEAQRLSLRRTAAISETLQGRLVQEAGGKAEGWSAWSETYGWSFNRDASGQVAAWQGHNFGEILGVQNTKAGLTLGLFGATGHTSSSFSSPSSTLKGDNFHGGVYAHVESGMSFFDGSFLAGRTEQKTTRTVSIGGVSGTGNAKFNTSEYAAHVRFGVVLPEVAKGLTLKPSFAVLLNGYSQGGATESGLAGVGVITEKVSDTAIQTRLGLEAGHAVKVVGKAAELSASLYWVHDADKGPRSVGTRFNGSNAPGYTAEGEAVGANALEVGLGASLTLTQRTSARLNGVWQVREGSSQPGVNLGLTVRF